MTLRRRFLPFYALLFITATSHARTAPRLNVYVTTHRVAGPQAPTAGVVFDDECVIINATILLAPIPDEPGVVTVVFVPVILGRTRPGGCH